MRGVPTNCRDISEVASFCGCISDEGSVDTEIREFCGRVADSEQVSGEDLAKLKEKLKDETDPDECCCEC